MRNDAFEFLEPKSLDQSKPVRNGHTAPCRLLCDDSPICDDWPMWSGANGKTQSVAGRLPLVGRRVEVREHGEHPAFLDGRRTVATLSAGIGRIMYVCSRLSSTLFNGTLIAHFVQRRLDRASSRVFSAPPPGSISLALETCGTRHPPHPRATGGGIIPHDGRGRRTRWQRNHCGLCGRAGEPRGLRGFLLERGRTGTGESGNLHQACRPDLVPGVRVLPPTGRSCAVQRSQLSGGSAARQQDRGRDRTPVHAAVAAGAWLR
jgi:hypothetical protein